MDVIFECFNPDFSRRWNKNNLWALKIDSPLKNLLKIVIDMSEKIGVANNKNEIACSKLLELNIIKI